MDEQGHVPANPNGPTPIFEFAAIVHKNDVPLNALVAKSRATVENAGAMAACSVRQYERLCVK